jgi:hypothetical protein
MNLILNTDSGAKKMPNSQSTRTRNDIMGTPIRTSVVARIGRSRIQDTPGSAAKGYPIGWLNSHQTLGIPSVYAIVGLAILSLVLANCTNSQQEVATRVANPTPVTPSPTIYYSPTPTATATPFPKLAPLVIPTPPANGMVLTFQADPDGTTWVSSKGSGTGLHDSNLHAGIIQGQTYASVLQFDLRGLAQGSKILFAILETTGRNSGLAGNGQWVLDLLNSDSLNFDRLTYDSLTQTPSLSTIGSALKSNELAVGLTNRFLFKDKDLLLLEKQLDAGILTLRLSGPSSGGDNLFTWNGDLGPGGPVLYVVAIPAPFVAITNTPTPQNVFAAATLAANQTSQAHQFGTPTSLPRYYATVTPGQYVVAITSIPTSASAAGLTAVAQYATAVAATTGTFTPTPSNWATVTPLPLLIPKEKLTPRPTAVPEIALPSDIELARTPLPAGLFNKIAFLEGPRFKQNVWIMDPDGSNWQLLTDRKVFDIAKVRDAFSPDGVYHVYQIWDPYFEAYQLWMRNLNFPSSLPVRIPSRGNVVYGQAWSPNNKKFAYVSNEIGYPEIFEYDIETRNQKQLTSTPDWFWNQFPSYSPDGMQIVYSTDRGHYGAFSEIWIMNADGTGNRKLGNNEWDTYNPVWIKWQK